MKEKNATKERREKPGFVKFPLSDLSIVHDASSTVASFEEEEMSEEDRSHCFLLFDDVVRKTGSRPVKMGNKESCERRERGAGLGPRQ